MNSTATKTTAPSPSETLDLPPDDPQRSGAGASSLPPAILSIVVSVVLIIAALACWLSLQHKRKLEQGRRAHLGARILQLRARVAELMAAQGALEPADSVPISVAQAHEAMPAALWADVADMKSVIKSVAEAEASEARAAASPRVNKNSSGLSPGVNFHYSNSTGVYPSSAYYSPSICPSSRLSPRPLRFEDLSRDAEHMTLELLPPAALPITPPSDFVPGAPEWITVNRVPSFSRPPSPFSVVEPSAVPLQLTSSMSLVDGTVSPRFAPAVTTTPRFTVVRSKIGPGASPAAFTIRSSTRSLLENPCLICLDAEIGPRTKVLVMPGCGHSQWCHACAIGWAVACFNASVPVEARETAPLVLPDDETTESVDVKRKIVCPLCRGEAHVPFTVRIKRPQIVGQEVAERREEGEEGHEMTVVNMDQVPNS